jgi:predicted nucleic acid-binding protein
VLLLYLDTSALVPAFVREATTEPIQAYLEQAGAEQLSSSAWVLTEFASALSLKKRTGAVTANVYSEALGQWRAFAAGLRLLEVSEAAFREAARFCDRSDLGLRAGDALHLAVAAAHGCTLVTLDRRMAEAAAELGVPVAAIPHLDQDWSDA